LTGATGSQGLSGTPGATGLAGAPGSTGLTGSAGAPGSTGSPGSIGLTGSTGLMGSIGLTGAAGTSLGFAEFYALMPGDNAVTVAAGTGVSFPRNGPTDGTGTITQTSPTTFQLANAGTYDVFFQVSISEAGQLVLVLNGTQLPYTVVGRATATSQIVGNSLVTTTVANSVLQVWNPTGNTPAETITPAAGGATTVSASLVIQRLH